MNEHYSLIPKTEAMPQEADFCLMMDNDLMAPVINKGERVYISRRQSPAELDVGIFLYKGRIYCRQFCEDYVGNLHLLCANPLRESENLCLGREEKAQCLCLGKVLLKAKAPMPIYK
jgi:hypothetical protein